VNNDMSGRVVIGISLGHRQDQREAEIGGGEKKKGGNHGGGE